MKTMFNNKWKQKNKLKETNVEMSQLQQQKPPQSQPQSKLGIFAMLDNITGHYRNAKMVPSESASLVSLVSDLDQSTTIPVITMASTTPVPTSNPKTISHKSKSIRNQTDLFSKNI